MPQKSEVSGKKWYELIEVIKIAQGFATGNQFTVLPNEVVTDIIDEMERLTELSEQANKDGLDLVSILEAVGETEDCGCTACVKITTLVLNDEKLKE